MSTLVSILQTMVVPTLVLLGLGTAMGVGLAVAAKFLYVAEDPLVEALADILPGANCGACGYPGCSGYAKELVAGVDVTLCSPGGNATVQDIARILGVEAVDVVEKVALVKCAGGRNVAPDRSLYVGPQTCRTAVLVGAGNKECRWGCIGLGDCADVCEDDAVAFTADGLAYVLADACIACARCVKACPRDLIEMVPKDRKVHVLCSSHDPGKNTKTACQVGCIACKLCARRDAKSFVIENNNASVIYGEGSQDIPVAALVCTPGTIWDADVYDQQRWLTDPGARVHLKEQQAQFKAAERAERAAKKAAAKKAVAAKKTKMPADQKADQKAKMPAEDKAPNKEPEKGAE
jgi:electron transport complex protein RnfB